MSRYLDVQNIAALIRKRGLLPFITDLAEYIRADYLRWPEFEKSARLASHSADGVIELMPVADSKLYGYKYVNGHPKNPMHGKPTVMAYGALAEVETGYPLLLCDLTLMTALRTAATSALAAQAMARPESASMAVIGNGAQSEFQVLAFYALLNIRDIHAYDLDQAQSERLKRNLEAYPDINVTLANSVEEAVNGADIVTTLTAVKQRASVITSAMIGDGVHINGVGGDCPGKTELDPELLPRAARVAVEFPPQTRVEGEVQQMPADFPVVELWRLLSGEVVGRTSEQELTVFDSVGFALEDFSSLRLVYDLAEQFDIGMNTDLVAVPRDVHNLFAALSD